MPDEKKLRGRIDAVFQALDWVVIVAGLWFAAFAFTWTLVEVLEWWLS